MNFLEQQMGKAASFLTGVCFITGHALNLGAQNSYGTVTGLTFVLFAHLLLVLSLMTAHSQLILKKGWLSAIGLAASVIGTILVTAIVYTELAGASGISVEAVFSSPISNVIHTYGPLLFVLGMLCFGAALLSNRGTKRLSGWLFITGTVVFAIGTIAGSLALWIELAGATITGTAFIILGSSLRAVRQIA